MINHALRGASELHGRAVCLPCFLRISGLFYQSQCRSYVATAQPTSVELGPGDGGDGDGARLPKSPAAFRRVRSVRNPPIAPQKLRIRPAPRAFSRGSSAGDSEGTPKAQRKASGAKAAAVSVAGHQRLRGGVSESTYVAESRVSGGRVKKTRQKGPSTKKFLSTSQEAVQEGVPFSSSLPYNSTIKEALSGKIKPSLTRKGTSPKDIRVIDPSTLDIQRKFSCLY